MTRQEIAKEIAKRTGFTSGSVHRVMDEFMDIVTDTVASGEGVYLRGFGTFMQVTRAAKTARNINKGTTIALPERKAVKFKPSDIFTEKLK